MNKSKHILLIGDFAQKGETLHSLIEGAGYRATLMQDPLAALNAMKQQKPDLVLVDSLLKEMNPDVFCIRMKDLGLSIDIPTLLLITEPAGEIIGEARDCDTVRFLVPEVDSQVLLFKIKQIFSAASASRSDSSELPLKGVRILLVEDNEINRRVAGMTLSKNGAQPDIAENGLVGLEQVTVNEYDLVLMDLQMPVMDGYESTARIRKLKHIKQPAIFALTSFVEAEEIERALQVGIDRVLKKPIRAQALISEVQQVLNR